MVVWTDGQINAWIALPLCSIGPKLRFFLLALLIAHLSCLLWADWQVLKGRDQILFSCSHYTLSLWFQKGDLGFWNNTLICPPNTLKMSLIPWSSLFCRIFNHWRDFLGYLLQWCLYKPSSQPLDFLVIPLPEDKSKLSYTHRQIFPFKVLSS